MNSLRDVLPEHLNQLFPDTFIASSPATAAVLPAPTLQTDEIQASIARIQKELDTLSRLLGNQTNIQNNAYVVPAVPAPSIVNTIEGVFNGEHMTGADGAVYPIPPNYASKSKLVEGDIMKLDIRTDGRYIFKQISPVERRRVPATLACLDGGCWVAQVDGREYRILTASVTFYKARSGSTITLILPMEGESTWGAVDHLLQ